MATELKKRPTNTKRTPEVIIAEQKTNAKTLADAQRAYTTTVPATTANVVLVVSDKRTDIEKYVDEIAPVSVVGRMIKFGRDGKFVTADDDEPIGDQTEFIALCDETLIGWIRFYRDGQTSPDRVQGLLFDGFVLPARDALGDVDQSQWDIGLSGRPEDPWKHQLCMPLQQADTRELFTFVTTSQTGRHAVGNLLRHFKRMQRTNAGEVPVVKLKAAGFNRRDERIGWVPTPLFAVVGRVLRDSAAKPDTSIAADLNDQIPHL